MLSILIVNWNTREMLRICLQSLQAACADLDIEIIVVDNASHDESAQMVADEFPEVVLLAQTRNLGFAKGNNWAYAHATGEFIWLLNPDTEVLGDAPQQLIEFFQDNPKVGAVASALVDARTGKIQRSCRTFPLPGALWAQALGLARAYPRSRRFGFYKMGWWNYRNARRVEQPMASSLMLRRRSIEAAGGLFDERFPIFFNDVDLCWRLRQAKQEIWFLPHAKVKHWGGAATSQLRVEMIRESHQSLRRFYELHLRNSLSPLVYWPTVWMFELAGRARFHWAQRQKRT
ncbi:MAG TPA: glycosyltransferase family 2 protein [Abditibacterium sp.]|jgi:hypothetical protein